jgi:hypothetical protein
MEIFRPDHPITNETEDRFQRYQFAKRIADISCGGKFSASLVIGIYGKWGEGKTSVINIAQTFIGDKAVTINFNPWLFQDQGHLLKAFFSAIGNAIGKNLFSRKGRALKLMSEYAEQIGALADFIHSGVGELIRGSKKIADILIKDSLSDLKKRLDDLIIETETNFVIFVDDIDRLDKQEIQVLFKMIKLVGDFPRTSYILAFDDEMVASALAPIYGGEGPSAGYAFLEKIIQVPLHLPQATPSALQKYTIELLNNCLQYLEYSLSEEDKNNFLGNFLNVILPSIKNPRIPVRLVNAIGFSLPLLKGEVNSSDLFLIECIKTVYPSLYHFIRTSSECLLTDYSNNRALIEPTQEDKEKYKNRILSELERHGIMKEKLLGLLIDLFPQIRHPFGRGNWAAIPQKWFQEKRICSPAYFQRYFSLVVLEGEISDVYFEDLLSSFGTNDINQVFQRFDEEIQTLSLEAFTIKVRNKTNWLPSNQARVMSLIMCRLGNQFSDDRIFSPRLTLCYLILDLLHKVSLDNRLDACMDVIATAQPIDLAVEIANWMKNYKIPVYGETVISSDSVDIIWDYLIKRFDIILQTEHIFDTMPDSSLWKITTIYYERGKAKQISDVLNTQLQASPNNVICIIKIFTPTIISSAVDYKPYKTNFKKEHYEQINRYINLEDIYTATVKVYGNPAVIPLTDPENGKLDDENLIAHFQHLHHQHYAEMSK